MRKNNSPPKLEKLLLRKYAFQGHKVTLRIDTVLTADGRRSTREVVEVGNSVGIVPVDNEGNILLVNQYRTAVGKNLLEIPAGGIEEEEDAEATVIREMQEETGFKPGKVTRLTGFYLSPGYTSEFMHIYLAEDLTPSQLTAEDTAGIEIVPTPADKIPEFISSGRIHDGKSIAGLLYYLKFKEEK